MPSLRERKEDLPLLVRAFLARLAHEGGPGAQAPQVDEATLSSLAAHDWPGNVRELRNVLERGVYLTAPGAPPGVRLVSLPGAAAPAESAAGPPFDAALSYRANKERWEDEFEKRYLSWLMQRSQGNISRAAREADMDRKYLHKLLKKHSIVA
jgi:DNA-binding NtrC family response regulator